MTHEEAAEIKKELREVLIELLKTKNVYYSEPLRWEVNRAGINRFLSCPKCERTNPTLWVFEYCPFCGMRLLPPEREDAS